MLPYSHLAGAIARETANVHTCRLLCLWQNESFCTGRLLAVHMQIILKTCMVNF